MTELALRTVQELLPNARDAQAFAQLVDVVRSRNALALVGAGVSTGLTYPDWNSLLNRMHDRINSAPERRQRASEFLKKYEDLLWRAEEYRRLLAADYETLLQETFGADNGTNAVTESIVRLPFRHILTTNYDASLERAHHKVRSDELRSVRWDEEPDLLDFLFNFHEVNRRYYVYIHGRYDHPATIVLSDADYTARYVRSEGAAKRLFALFALQRVVFLGFSLSDPDLMAIMREVNVTVGTKDKARHFAFIGVGEGVDREVHRSRMLLKFGINPVFYDTTKGHGGLEQLLVALVTLAEAPHGLESTLPVGASAASRSVNTSSRGARSTSRSANSASRSTPSNVSREASVERGASNGSDRPIDRSPLPPITDATDPQKGRFGGLAEDDDRRLSAVVTEDANGWFKVRLTVESTDPQRPVTGTVRLYLHDTFPDPQVEIQATGGKATESLLAYGAFTVGAVVEDDGTRLELDLAMLDDAPMAFRMS